MPEGERFGNIECRMASGGRGFASIVFRIRPGERDRVVSSD